MPISFCRGKSCLIDPLDYFTNSELMMKIELFGLVHFQKAVSSYLLEKLLK